MSNSGNDGSGGGAGRPDLGFASELESFDPADWQPRRPTPRPVTENGRKTAEAAAEKTGFRRRDPAPLRTEPQPEPAAEPPRRPVRRRRTGRNAQFNIKARPETIDAFCAIADARGWGLGETLEKAVALMQETWGTADEDETQAGQTR